MRERNDLGKCDGRRGIALVMTLILLAMLMTMLLGYFTLTRIGMTTTKSTMDSIDGLYAAEAGLNLRADQVRQIFQGYNRPAGTSPDPALPLCEGGNDGSGDMACLHYQLRGKDVLSYVVEPPGNPEMIVIPRGELYQNLNAQEYGYIVESVSHDDAGRAHAVLELHFKSRLVPMFQFAAFYNKDLEILPGPDMTLAGPVHTNGDLYLGTHNDLDILGQVTTAGDLYRGRKDEDTCLTGDVRIEDPDDLQEIPECSGGRRLITQAEVTAWNGMIETGVDPVTVPPPETLDPVPGEVYWDRADIRIALDLNGATPAIEVRNQDGGTNASLTSDLAACGATGHSSTFYNNREASYIEMLDVDVEALLDCLHLGTFLGAGVDIDETTEGGLVWHLTVDGPDSDTINNYGVRVTNGAELASDEGTAPEIAGLTIVTNQAMYIQGDYNAIDKKPAAFLADSLNILSNAWSDAAGLLSVDSRVASDTTIQAALMAGTDTTGGVEGSGGQGGAYNGGLENYPRLHEKWSSKTLTYLGSFVSLNTPQHVDGAWVYGNPQYKAPNRNWGYDTDFDDASRLPPLSPRFVYLKQQLFLREFEF